MPRGSNTSLLAIGLVSGLLVFGALFAINSSIHSYLIVAYAREDGTLAGCGLLLYVQRRGSIGWHPAIWLGLSTVWFGRLPTALLDYVDYHCGDFEKATRLNRRTNFYRQHMSARVCVF